MQNIKHCRINNPVELMGYIKAIEAGFGIKAELNLLPLQPGDAPDTFAGVSDLVREFDYQPKTSVQEGIEGFVEWYKAYYEVSEGGKPCPTLRHAYCPAILRR